MGCPLIGNIDFYTKQGSVETGPGDFYRRQAAKVQNRNIFRYMVSYESSTFALFCSYIFADNRRLHYLLLYYKPYTPSS